MYHVYIMAITVAQIKKFNIIPHFSATRPLEISSLDPPSVCPFGGSQSAYHLSFVLGRMRFFCLLLKIGKCLRKNTNNKINIKNTKNVGKESLSVGIFFFHRAFLPMHLEGRHCVQSAGPFWESRGRFEKVPSSLSDKTTLDICLKIRRNDQNPNRNILC